MIPVSKTEALPPLPPLVCDCCSWPMSAHEIVRLPDGAIPGLLTCSLCVEDALAARTMETAA